MEFKVTGKQSENMFKVLENWYNESAASDAHEESLRESLRKFKKLIVKAPKNTKYSDIFVSSGNKQAWIEVKMNHSDNLPNPRFFYDGKSWGSTYDTPAAKIMVKLLNESPESKKFIGEIKAFTKIKSPKMGSGFDKNDPSYVGLDKLRKFFAGKNDQYFFRKEGVDVAKIVAAHYTSGKAEPAQYIQTGDDFYLFGPSNPMGLPAGIPVLKGKGAVKARFSMRSSAYEIQAEIKFDTKTIQHSAYSILPGSKKKNPFDKYR